MTLSVSAFTSLMPDLGEPPIKFIRYRPEKRQVCLIDVVRVLCNEGVTKAGRRVATAIAKLDEDITQKLDTWKFKGARQQNVKICDAKTLIAIIMVLPGERAKQLRIQFVDILSAVLSGDVVQRQGVAPEEAEFWRGAESQNRVRACEQTQG